MFALQMDKMNKMDRVGVTKKTFAKQSLLEGQVKNNCCCFPFIATTSPAIGDHPAWQGPHGSAMVETSGNLPPENDKYDKIRYDKM